MNKVKNVIAGTATSARRYGIIGGTADSTTGLVLIGVLGALIGGVVGTVSTNDGPFLQNAGSVIGALLGAFISVLIAARIAMQRDEATIRNMARLTTWRLLRLRRELKRTIYCMEGGYDIGRTDGTPLVLVWADEDKAQYDDAHPSHYSFVSGERFLLSVGRLANEAHQSLLSIWPYLGSNEKFHGSTEKLREFEEKLYSFTCIGTENDRASPLRDYRFLARNRPIIKPELEHFVLSDAYGQLTTALAEFLHKDDETLALLRHDSDLQEWTQLSTFGATLADVLGADDPLVKAIDERVKEKK